METEVESFPFFNFIWRIGFFDWDNVADSLINVPDAHLELGIPLDNVVDRKF